MSRAIVTSPPGKRLIRYSPAESLRREGAASVSAVASGPARQTLRKWLAMQRESDGESVFLTEPDSWIQGEVAQLNAREEPLTINEWMVCREY